MKTKSQVMLVLFGLSTMTKSEPAAALEAYANIQENEVADIPIQDLQNVQEDTEVDAQEKSGNSEESTE